MRFFLLLLPILPLVGLAAIPQPSKASVAQGTKEKPFITSLRARAMQGQAKAQFDLGVCYRFGQGVPQNDAEAVKWYRKAAEQGYAKAQYNLGVCCDTGRGVSKDVAEAVSWYRKAGEQGHAKAQFNLGVSYKYGQGVTKDLMEAYAWLSLAAAGGVPKALHSRDEVVKNLSPLNLERAQTRERQLREDIRSKPVKNTRRAKPSRVHRQP